MLTKPEYGWTDFHLEGTSTYELSYLDDIAFEWVAQAIHGLEMMLPFCVKGFMEPGRFLCVVSYWNCHITIEDDERHPLQKERIKNEYAHISMLDFCKYLHGDISSDIDEWAAFTDYTDDETYRTEKKKALVQQLAKLEALIGEREEWFGENRCFL